jgi:hypothetical protein
MCIHKLRHKHVVHVFQYQLFVTFILLFRQEFFFSRVFFSFWRNERIEVKLHALRPADVLLCGQNSGDLICIPQYVLVKGDSFVLPQFGTGNGATPSLRQAGIHI